MKTSTDSTAPEETGQDRLAFLARVPGMRALSQNPLMRYVASKGLSAFIIKVANAGLTYAMFLVLANAMGAVEYGWFAFVFSLGSLGAFVAAAGQHTYTLKQIPVFMANGQYSQARGLMRLGYQRIAWGTLVMGALLLVATGLSYALSTPRNTLFVAASILLVLPFALAEYQSHVLRAFGFMNLALGPRDVIWRVLVLGLVGLWFLTISRPMTGMEGYLLVTVLLAGLMLWQGREQYRRMPAEMRKAPVRPYREKWVDTSCWLWVASITGIISSHLAVVTITSVLGPSDAGAYFSAQKTSLLITLPHIAAVMVSSPLIARYYHSGQFDEIKRLFRYLLLGLVVPSFALFAIVITWSSDLLALFDPEYVNARGVLILLTFGYTFMVLCGPAGQMLLMSGRERHYIVYLLVSDLSGLLLGTVLSLKFGLIGFGIGTTFGVIAWNVLAVMDTRRTMGVDSSLLGLLLPVRTAKPNETSTP